jgi:hypothetical protein
VRGIQHGVVDDSVHSPSGSPHGLQRWIQRSKLTALLQNPQKLVLAASSALSARVLIANSSHLPLVAPMTFTMPSLPTLLLTSLYALSLFLILATSLYTLYLLTQLYKNYTTAQQTGLPIFIVPFDANSVVWLFLYSYFGGLLARFRCFRLLGLTWAWQDNDKVHRAFGQSYVLVNTGGCVVHSSDAVVVDWVLGRRKEFPKPAIYGEFFWGGGVWCADFW